MNHEKAINVKRLRRRRHVRGKIRGTPDRPRLTVFRSNKNIAVQVVDDDAGKTLVSASTRDKSLRGDFAYGGNKDAAARLGKIVAEKALAAGIKQVKFDRGHYKYHGRIAALADAAREAGLSF
jgi:large subunit ribosomal protein L18